MEDDRREAMRINILRRFKRRLRKRQTAHEQIMWELLRNRRFNNLKFYRQYRIGSYIVDFLCKSHRLVLEVDGEIHRYKELEDCKRKEKIQTMGYSIVRCTNDEVETCPLVVLNRIEKAIGIKQT